MTHVMGMKRFALGLLLSVAAFLSTPALSQQDGDILDARILPGWQKADGTHVAALRIDLRDGWKTYWRAPGDAGIPPRFDWSRSRNLDNVTVSWPTPKRILQGGVHTIGYEHSLTLPLILTPSRTGKAIDLNGKVTIGVCKDVCVPMTLKLSQKLAMDQTKPDPQIVAALADRPYTAKEAKVGRVACRLSPIADGLHLRAEVDVPKAGGKEVAVIEVANPMVWVAQAKTTRKGGRIIAETELYHVEGRSFAVDRSGVRITVLGKNHAVDIRGCSAG